MMYFTLFCSIQKYKPIKQTFEELEYKYLDSDLWLHWDKCIQYSKQNHGRDVRMKLYKEWAIKYISNRHFFHIYFIYRKRPWIIFKTQ